jgi:predicted RecB family nuclease
MNTFGDHRVPLLSKSRFTSGLQCHKRLYLECYNRDVADEVTDQQQAIFDAGTDVGALARNLYPGGVLISEDYLNHEGAVASTTAVLSRSHVPPIYEAAFLHDGVRIRADILAPAGDGQFDLLEVKSTSKVKEEHIYDIGIQLYVLRGSGIAVRRACLCHLNTDYVYEGGDYKLGRLFRVEDVTKECLARQSGIPSLLAAMRLALTEAAPPDVRTGRHCTRPYTCQFYGHCHEDQTEHHVSQLPRIREELLDSLEAAGIEDIRDIPAGFPGLNPLQRRVRDCVIGDRVHLDTALPTELRQLTHPIHFLDFETFNPALPLYRGTRPYQVIPFQWSLHTLNEDGNLRHNEFLHDGAGDPRRAFAESLLSALGDEGPILVYSGFEASRLRELSFLYPELSARLDALLNGRIVDLLQLVRAHSYHPAFHGSFSMKSVLPALIPHLGYDDLAINDGTLAAMAYAEMLQPETGPERRSEIRTNLLAYCERDTLAEVELFRFFTHERS